MRIPAPVKAMIAYTAVYNWLLISIVLALGHRFQHVSVWPLLWVGEGGMLVSAILAGLESVE